MAELTMENRSVLTNLKRPVAVVSALVAFNALSACSSDNDPGQLPNQAESSSTTPETRPSRTPEKQPQPKLGLGEQVLAVTVVCKTLDTDTAVARLLAKRDQVVVDGRCDAAPEAPVGVYVRPTQRSESIGAFRNGEVLDAGCVKHGERIQNVRGDGTNEWVTVGSRDVITNIPAIWVQGEASLPKC